MSAARTRLPRAERERRILDAALREFDQEGFRGASVERIAEAAGITKALVYQYFGSKEGVYTACAERGRAEMFAEMERTAAAAGEDPAAILAAVVSAYFDQLDKLRGRSYVLYGDAPRGAVDEMRRRNAETIAGLLRAEAGVLEQRDARLAQPALGRDRDPQAVLPARRFRRSSTVRYPPSPYFSQCATRVTVAVEAPVCFDTSRYGRPSSTSRAACQRCDIASSSEIVHRSRKNLAASSSVLNETIVRSRSSISGVRHSCEPSAVDAIVLTY